MKDECKTSKSRRKKLIELIAAASDEIAEIDASLLTRKTVHEIKERSNSINGR